jgi:flagellar biosynthesis protein FliR
VIAVAVMQVETQLPVLALAMLRPGAMLLAAPMLGAASVPVQVRVMLAVAVGLLSAATVDFAGAAQTIASLEGLIFVLGELLIGVSIGFAVQIGVAAAQVAGEFISNAMGLGFAAMQDPVSGASSPAVSQFLLLLATMWFLASGAHLLLIEIVIGSYRAFPPVPGGVQRDAIGHILELGALMFSAGAVIALPTVTLLLGVQIVMAFVARAAPAFNLFAVGIPATLLVGVVMLGVVTPLVMTPISSALEAALAVSANVAR